MPQHRKWLAVTAACAVIGATLTGFLGTSAFASTAPSRLTELGTDLGEFTPAFKPLAADPSRRMTVVLKMAGDPVAVVRSRAPGKQLPEGEKARIENELGARHDAIKGDIRARGATVLADLKDAYNGIKVEAPVSSIDALRSLPDVVSVRTLPTYDLDNTVSVPYIGAPSVWAGTPGFRGDGIKVAIIDTGIDYTHANFGGPGSPAAFEAAKAAQRAGKPADPALFGADAPKVKGGFDFVGDDYDPTSPNPANHVPHPGPNPLDCNGHGSHVSGTAAGFGVTSAGATYTGPYDSTTYNTSFTIGPGVAPRADLYAVRVFGCTGPTNVVVDAIDWAVAHDMQVINMSLGAAYGTADDPSAEASRNAAEAGIIVVASAGNSGNAPYITGSPSVADKVIAAAATDSTANFPGANLALSTGKTITALDANGAALNTSPLPVVVLRDASGGVSLGCSEAEYVDSVITGKLVVTLRGVCARVSRAQFGQAHHAAAVAMINTANTYPPFEGAIPGVSIPFLGIRSSDGPALVAAGTATASPVQIANPAFRAFADFTSAGPRRLDSALKPDITAPGVSVMSTASGTGNQGERLSGTSMAAPHVSGVAALALQAHSDWDTGEVRAAIVNTAAPDQVAGFHVSLGGTGLVQAPNAVGTMAAATGDDESPNVSFGFVELTGDFSGKRHFQVTNHGSSPITFNITTKPDGGQPHTVAVKESAITVKPGDSRNVSVSLTVPISTAGNSAAFREVSGEINLTPASPAMNNGIALHVPYYLVPRARSNVRAELTSAFSPQSPNSSVALTNRHTAVAGSGDFYAWGLAGDHDNLGQIGLRAVGVQSFPFGSTNALVFAINTFARWSSPDVDEFDILIDTTGSGKPNFLVFGLDLGRLQTGSFSGQMAAGVLNLATGRARVRFLASAPTDGSTIELPVLASDLGLNAASPRFSYFAQSFDLRDQGALSDTISTTAAFNAFSSAISTGQLATVAPNGSATVPVTISPAEWLVTPARGLMIVTLDNRSGGRQATLLPVTDEERGG